MFNTWIKIAFAKGNQKKARVAILVSDKIDHKAKSINRDKKEIFYNDT